jgi:valyl-tRNA synthetase
VYLEAVKPVFQGESVEAATVSRNVLYTCLDVGLRIISPFMPFVSEELYQRLKRRTPNEPPSICVTPYPEEQQFPWRDVKLEADVEFMQTVVHAIRSARSEYTLPNKVKADVYLRCSDETLASELRRFIPPLQTLSYSSKVEVLTTTPPPTGCAILIVSDRCEIHLMLKGLIDPAKEIEKLKQKHEKLQGSLSKLQTAMAVTDYEVKVPEEVRTNNSEKLTQTEGEIEKLVSAIAALKTME